MCAVLYVRGAARLDSTRLDSRKEMRRLRKSRELCPAPSECPGRRSSRASRDRYRRFSPWLRAAPAPYRQRFPLRHAAASRQSWSRPPAVLPARSWRAEVEELGGTARGDEDIRCLDCPLRIFLLHGDERSSVLRADVVDGADMWMGERRGGPGLALVVAGAGAPQKPTFRDGARYMMSTAIMRMLRCHDD